MGAWGGIKRTTADAAFSDYIRERAWWTCEWAGCFLKFDGPHSGIHCSHFITRGNMRVRFDPDNAACFCAHHHDHAGKNPDEHDTFFRRRLGEDRYLALIVRARTRRSVRVDLKLEVMKWRAAVRDLRALRGPRTVGARA